MVDYLAWAKADPLTVEQAARLWAEVDPSDPQFMWTQSQAAEIGARLQMLCGRIATRELHADHRGNGLESIGRYERSLIFRSELTALAERLGERPRFLFVALPSGSAATNTERARNTPPPCPAGLDKAAISRLFGPEIAEPSASISSPLRVVPGARRISKAPPPPQYVHGPVGPLPKRVPITPAAGRIAALDSTPQKTTAARAAGRRGAAVPKPDEAILAEMKSLEALDGDGFSVRAFVLVNEKRISGPNIDAKVRRLQRKYDKQKS